MIMYYVTLLKEKIALKLFTERVNVHHFCVKSRGERKK